MEPFRRAALPTFGAPRFGLCFRSTELARNILRVYVFGTPGKEFSSLSLPGDYKKYSSRRCPGGADEE